MTNWIACADGLPEESTPNRTNFVLIWYRCSFADWRVHIGERVCGYWRPEGSNGNFDDSVSHWMPLPEPPPATQNSHKA